MRFKSKEIATTSVFLAIAIVSMFFKNLNVFFSGTVVNACLILISLFAGLPSAIVASIVTPIFSFIITGAPIIAAIPFIMPMIMIGNIILCIFVSIFSKNNKRTFKIIMPMIIGSIVKAAFMGIVISLIILPIFLPGTKLAESPKISLVALQFTYSGVQLITALLASVLSTVIYKILFKR